MSISKKQITLYEHVCTQNSKVICLIVFVNFKLNKRINCWMISSRCM
jgi:hypothetical protein